MFLLRSYLTDKININFLRAKYVGLIVSFILIVFSVIGLFTKGLNYGIDFKGGILIEVRFNKVPDLAKLRSSLNGLNIGEITIQTIGEKAQDVLIKSGLNKQENLMQNADLIKKTITENISDDVEFRKVEFVGAEVGKEMISDGVIAILLTFIAIMIYIWIRFNWQYSIGIVIGLIHDLILTVGYLVYSKFEFNTTSIAALLTILGYSVNDTVVIYDRIRENLYKIRRKSFAETLNLSINGTFYRTIFTLLTTLVAAGSLILFGGEALHSFSITVFIGIIIGTYSSIFISIPILSFFEKAIYKK